MSTVLAVDVIANSIAICKLRITLPVSLTQHSTWNVLTKSQETVHQVADTKPLGKY